MRAIVLSAGTVTDYECIRNLVRPGPGDLVICADGGAVHALALGLRPHLLIGDFDSIPPGVHAQIVALGTPVQQVPVEKDQTDTHLAIEAALARGATELVLVGGVGSRLDHTVANLLLLPRVPVPVLVVNEHNIAQVLPPGASLHLHGRTGDTFSLLPLTPEVTGVAATGCHWPLHGARLSWGSSLGVSNRLGPEGACISSETGWLLVIQAWD